MIVKRSYAALLAASACLCAAGVATAQAGGSPAFVNQGRDWTPIQRIRFYTQDQGSQLMPLAWLRALKGSDGRPFLADSLARYGYLPNPASAAGLPVGFTSATLGTREMAGMSCAACHTREIVVGEQRYRIDGGPAIVDFQRFLVDLDGAVGRVADDPGAFAAFAAEVLGSDASKPKALEALRQDLALYHKREHEIVTRSLPRPDMWGLGRLDAVSMIMNRVAGLDIGPPPTYLIPANIAEASSPVRYPFLWNAPKQDYTQWPAFAPNGNAIFGLARNTGEVYGVFGTFHPRKDAIGLADLHSRNSANFRGLKALEDLLWKMRPPQWPFGVDSDLAAKGEPIYQRVCASCHGETKGATRSLFYSTWKTLKQDVGTDSREYDVLKRRVDTGWLGRQRLPVPIFSPKLGNPANATDLLRASVIGAMLQRPFELPLVTSGGISAARKAKAAREQLKAADAEWRKRTDPIVTGSATSFAYEARVLHGIWATAPYLHNGSVPTLSALLTRDAERPERFAVGRYYDTRAVGLAEDQRGTGTTRITTGCGEGRHSGNSRCGHNYGVTLSPPEKAALLEYLKRL